MDTSASSSLVADPVKVIQVVVPLDGSPFAERALPVAAWVAEALEADVRLVAVAVSDEDAEGAIRYLDGVGHHHQATSWDVLRDEDVAGALAAVATSGESVACLATHGRDRSAALLGSVAAALLDRSIHPVLLIGPEARARRTREDAVVVGVDGTPRDQALLRVALGWAERLARQLVIVTVAEPVPSIHDRSEPRRAHGPADPEGYLTSLATRVNGLGVAVGTRVIYDPISVRDGLVPLLAQTAALVVLGSGRRHGAARMVLGTHAARVVHDAAVPALLVPPQ